jgi:hypothetical protein
MLHFVQHDTGWLSSGAALSMTRMFVILCEAKDLVKSSLRCFTSFSMTWRSIFMAAEAVG